jgi:hypothetical protein
MDMLSHTGESSSSHSPMQLHFLKRLNRLLRLRAEQAGQLNAEGVRLIDRAIYCTYCDCADVGVLEDAQQLLHRVATSAASRK